MFLLNEEQTEVFKEAKGLVSKRVYDVVNKPLGHKDTDKVKAISYRAEKMFNDLTFGEKVREVVHMFLPTGEMQRNTMIKNENKVRAALAKEIAKVKKELMKMKEDDKKYKDKKEYLSELQDAKKRLEKWYKPFIMN